VLYLFCNDPRLPVDPESPIPPELQQSYKLDLGEQESVGYMCKSRDSWMRDEEYIEELIRIIEERENCQR
jgi:hypothetical protein